MKQSRHNGIYKKSICKNTNDNPKKGRNHRNQTINEAKNLTNKHDEKAIGQRQKNL